MTKDIICIPTIYIPHTYRRVAQHSVPELVIRVEIVD